MQGNIQRRTAFRGAEFDYALGLQVVHQLRQDDQFLWKHAEITGKRKKQFGRAGAIHSREKLIDLFRGNFEIVPPRQSLPQVGQTKAGVQMIGVGDEAESGRRTIAQQNAERVQIERGESTSNALHRGRVGTEMVQGVVFGEIGHS